MQWSRLKSRVKRLIEPALARRIDFHVTSYRESHDECERGWITLDGKMVFETSWYQHQQGRNELRPQDLGSALRTYPDLPIDEALNHSDPIIRAFAIVDRRLGRRRIADISTDSRKHPLVDLFYHLRTESGSPQS
jgi:hypothetical protein